MITINCKNWLEICKDLSNKTYNEYKSNSYIFKEVIINNFQFDYKNPFDICCYTNSNGKLSTLKKQYYNEESFSKVNDSDITTVSMIGGEKWGTTKNNKHCINNLVVNHLEKSVTIYFRNSDFFKKFLIDIYFIKECLKEKNIENYQINCYFENLTLRTPFVYIFLNQLYIEKGEDEIINFLTYNWLGINFLFYTQKIKDKQLNYKSLERANRYLQKTKVYKDIIKGLIL